MSESELPKRRSRALAPAYELFYEEPVHLVRGEGLNTDPLMERNPNPGFWY